MTKKLKILSLGIVLPALLAYLYNIVIDHPGNWLEDYANTIKMGLLIISLISSIYLGIVSKKENNNIWLSISIFFVCILIILIYLAYAVISITF